MAIHIQIRRKSAAQWLIDDSVLYEGEFGFELDTKKIKIGDGSTVWHSLPYIDSTIPFPHADTHAAGQSDELTLAAIDSDLAAALPPVYGAGNKLATMSDIIPPVTVQHISAASFTPVDNMHYICADDVEVLAPATPVTTNLWESSITFEAGAALTFPAGWRVSRTADPVGGNRCRISYANDANWYLDWEASYSTAPTPPTPGSAIYVSKDGNDANDGSSWAQAKLTPQAAFNIASSGNQVWIAQGTYNAATTNGFAPPAGLTIYGGFYGNETAVADRAKTADPDGIGAAVFTYPTILTNSLAVTPGALYVIYANIAPAGTPCTFNGFTITDGKCGVYGTSGGSVMMVDCIISGLSNTGVASDGGGLQNANATSCTITSCSAGRYGGGAHNATVLNCVFTGCSAVTAGGGVNSCNVTNCIFTSNSSANGGGAYISTINNCQFITNTVTVSGGGAHTCSCSNSTFTSNTAVTSGGGGYGSTYINCAFTTNSTPGVGGGVSNFASCTNCTFTGNTAVSYAGGANTGTTLTNCTFTSNSTSTSYAGAVFNVTTITGCTFTNNSSITNSGAVSTFLTMTNCTFTGNTTVGNSGAGGGAIYCNATSPNNFTVTGCTFTSNVCTAGIGGACNFYEGNTIYTVTSCTFTENIAYYSGGAIHSLYSGQGPVGTITGCTFIRNVAQYTGISAGGASTYGGGGAVYSGGDLCHILNSYFIGNYVNATGNAGDSGGATKNCGRLWNCIFARNYVIGAYVGQVNLTGPTTNCYNNLYLHNGNTSYALVSATQTFVNCLFWRNCNTIGGSTQTNCLLDAGLALANFVAPADIAAGRPENGSADAATIDAAVLANGYDTKAITDPQRNGGSIVLINNTSALDIVNRTRKYGGAPGIIDVGPYEFQG